MPKVRLDLLAVRLDREDEVGGVSAGDEGRGSDDGRALFLAAPEVEGEVRILDNVAGSVVADNAGDRAQIEHDAVDANLEMATGGALNAGRNRRAVDSSHFVFSTKKTVCEFFFFGS